jgi:hypothetical protein
MAVEAMSNESTDLVFLHVLAGETLSFLTRGRVPAVAHYIED